MCDGMERIRVRNHSTTAKRAHMSVASQHDWKEVMGNAGRGTNTSVAFQHNCKEVMGNAGRERDIRSTSQHDLYFAPRPLHRHRGQRANIPDLFNCQ